MRLKHGEILVFEGANWRLAGDSKWRPQPRYVPNYWEKPVGLRKIGGVEHAVFQVLTGDFAAQPRTLCEQKLPEEPSEREHPPLKDIGRPGPANTGGDISRKEEALIEKDIAFLLRRSGGKARSGGRR